MTSDSFDLEPPSRAATDPWNVFRYEVTMYWGMIRVREQISTAGTWNIVLGTRSNDGDSNKIDKSQKQLVMNAMIEGKLLHMRVLVEIMLGKSKSSDDLSLDDLIRKWKGDKQLSAALSLLSKAYGNTKTPDSPCWIINKMMAHPTTFRMSSFDYSALFHAVDPHIKKCVRRVSEIKSDHYLLMLLDQV